MRDDGAGRWFGMRLMLGCAMMLVARVNAGGQTLPPVETESLSAAQKQAIAGFVSEQVKKIAGGASAAEVFTAQTALVELMRSGDMSIEYRQEISKSSSAELEGLVQADDEAKAVSALVLAGELGVRPCDRIIERGLQDKREMVRVAAAGAAKRMMHILAAAQGQQSIRAPGAELQGKVAGALDREQSAQVARALLSALSSTQEDPEFSVNGNKLLCASLERQAARLRAMPIQQSMSSDWAETLFWGLGAVREALIEPNPTLQVDEGAKRSAARAAGLVLAMVSVQTQEESADLSRMEGLVGVAEQVLLMVEASLTRKQAGQQSIATSFKSGVAGGEWKPFQDAVQGWVGARGKLVRAPFTFSSSDF